MEGSDELERQLLQVDTKKSEESERIKEKFREGQSKSEFSLHFDEMFENHQSESEYSRNLLLLKLRELRTYLQQFGK